MTWSAEKQRAYYQANPARWRWYRRLWAYGLTREGFNTLWEQQDGACGICRRPFSSEKAAQIDHDHTTELVRGLLCASCNRSLVGLDTPGWLEAAQLYLKSMEANH